jgi:glycolate oxidase iron-sulfur subunit
MEFFLTLAFLGKRLGISRLLNRMGILRRISPALAAAEEMVDGVPRHFLRSLLPAAPPDAEVVQFLACGPNYLRPSVGEATARLLARGGAKAGCGANVCCGLPGVSYGDLEAARSLARRNIESLEKFPRAVVLVDDSSCAATLKDYPRLFADDPAWLPRAQALAGRTRDVNEWLAAHVPSSGSPAARPPVVAYHDPCKARYGQGIVEPPRQILKALPVEYRELPEADQCCGGGGTYSFVHADISRAVLARKVENIKATGADVVLTTSVSCLLQLDFGLRRGNCGVRARHLCEFLDYNTLNKR